MYINLESDQDIPLSLSRTTVTLFRNTKIQHCIKRRYKKNTGEESFFLQIWLKL